MSLSPIGEPTMTPDQIHTISQAATTLASIAHYMKHGTVYDRKWSAEAEERKCELEAIIEDERKRRTVKEAKGNVEA